MSLKGLDSLIIIYTLPRCLCLHRSIILQYWYALVISMYLPHTGKVHVPWCSGPFCAHRRQSR